MSNANRSSDFLGKARNTNWLDVAVITSVIITCIFLLKRMNDVPDLIINISWIILIMFLISELRFSAIKLYNGIQEKFK